ncbi:dTDP-4-dehydrorhamnose reductase [Hansschlegelia sp. KR7-227]|uniref:dTDP-4-dehydrorhamnose reductase n=1 Tax=Hansschlegelia sp. KR7-227 TaxID=3400914 RepID=UPI003C106933
MTVILVTGGSGQVGHELVARHWPAGVEIIAPSRAELDLTDLSATKAFLADRKVDAVINPAAYTAVDKAETEVAAAFETNALVPAVLAEATRDAGVPLIHVSTDYVFDGTGSEPYEVDAPVRPLGVYGASKAAGEYAVTLGNPRSAVVRTAWVVSARRSNFVKTMLRYGQERDVMKVVADQRGAPTFAADLADALATITLRMMADKGAPTGVFHFSNDGGTTWHDFAAAIFDVAKAKGLKTPRLEPIGTTDYPTPARRPANSLLSTARITRDYGVRPRPWRDGLPQLIDDILRTAA